MPIFDRSLIRLDHYLQYEKAFFKEDVKAAGQATGFEQYYVTKNNDPLKAGMDNVAKLDEILNKFDRHPLQVEMHNGFTKCATKILFGAETVRRYENVIMKKYNYKDLVQELIVIAARRYGKSVACAMWFLAIALVVTRLRIAIFSTGGRASKNMMEMILNNMIKLKIPEHLYKVRDECLTIKMAHGDERKIFAFPAADDR